MKRGIKLKYYNKYAPLYLAWIIIALLAAYKIIIVQKDIYDKYNGQVGIIEWVSVDYTGIHICGVRLQDGTYDVVNAGRYNWKKGDKYINNMQYSVLFGFMGVAYSVEPYYMPGVFWDVAYIITFILPLTIVICYCVAKWWMDFSSAKEQVEKRMSEVLEIINHK